MRLSKSKQDYRDLSTKIAFLAVFGVTGIAALVAYRYIKQQMNGLDNIDWDEIWKDIK